MRIFKLASALIVVLAFSAVAVATASAAETLWLLLPGAAGTTFTGKSAKATLQVETGPKGEKPGASITCQESTSTGEITEGQTLGKATITFGSKCTAAGLPVENQGAKTPGVIVANVLLHTCVIKAEDAGMKIQLDEDLKLEVPSTQLKISIRGSIIALVSPNKKSQTGPFTLTVAQKEGLQAIQSCEGGATTHLETAFTEKGGVKLAFTESGQEAKEGIITFKEKEEIMV